MPALDLHWLQDDAEPFPPTAQALGPDSEAPGLLCAGGRLDARHLEAAYRHGVFPWYSEGQPVLWWAPDPRMVLPVAAFKLSRSLKKTLLRFLRTPGNEVRFDSAFERVIQACANTPRDGQAGTWILPPLQRAYVAWHHAGRAHSIETWVNGQLVGGLYGVGIGRMFFGESMFSHASDASKISLTALVAFCRGNHIGLIDCQQNTEHLASLGAREIPRADFERHLALTMGAEGPARWSYDPAHWAQLGLDTADAAA